MPLLEALSSLLLLSTVILGCVLPAALLCAQTAYLLRCWKSHSRGELPMMAEYHFAAGPRGYKSWPTRADALPRYLMSLIPGLNAVLLFVTLLLIVFLGIPRAIANTCRVSRWMRCPL